MPGYENKNYYKTVFVLIILSLISAFFVYFPLTNTDIWWHLTAAREMFSRKTLLYTDPFAYTLHNPKWIDIHWLFQIISYGIFKIAGVEGLVLFKSLIVACISVLIAMAFPDKRYMVISSAVFALFVFESKYLILVRPVIITLMCIAVFIFSFEHYIRTRDKRYLLALLPVQIVWTNSQGLFPLGMAIAGCYLLGEFMQRIIHCAKFRSNGHPALTKILPVDLVIAFLLIVSSSLLNPFGWRGFLFPVKLFSRIDPSVTNMYARNISENIPLFELAGKDTHYLYTVIIAGVAVLFTFWINKRAFRWAHLLLFGIFLSLAFMAKRNIILYLTVLPPVIGYNYVMGCEKGVSNLCHWLRSEKDSYNRVMIGLTSLLLLFFISCHAIVVTRCPKKSTISPFRVPRGAVSYLKVHPVEGKMFNSIRHGGYLMWHFYPEKQVFIDGRLIIRSPEFFQGYLSILDSTEQFETIATCYGITHAVLPMALFNRYMPLVKALYQSSEWDLAFADGGSVLFVKSDVNRGGRLDLDSQKDVAAVKERINRKWSGDRYIREEALGYFDNLVAYLFT